MREKFLSMAVLLAGLLLATAGLARTYSGTVVRVTDGDSVLVRPDGGGKARPIRIHGIDAPEICQAFGPQARDALASRLQGQSVQVETRDTDRYRRTVARLHAADGDVGAWMVSRGFAWSYRYKDDPGPYAQLQAAARQSQLGLWAEGRPTEPRVFRKRHGSCHHR